MAQHFGMAAQERERLQLCDESDAVRPWVEPCKAVGGQLEVVVLKRLSCERRKGVVDVCQSIELARKWEIGKDQSQQLLGQLQ